MRLFKISGNFSQDASFKKKKEIDFIGYFVKRNDTQDVIEGYLEETFSTFNNPIRYIKGLYLEDSHQLVFLKMFNSLLFLPLVYTFSDIQQGGYWDEYDFLFGFFGRKKYQGHAKVDIQEITADEKKSHLIEQTLSIFRQKASSATFINQVFMEQVAHLKDFLDAPYYPKE